MLKIVAASVALAGVAMSDSVPVVAPSYAPAPVYEARPLNYAFLYGVNSEYNGDKIPTIFGHDETAEPTAVNGCYEVFLPDGRYQTVRYTADPTGYGGYNPIISYSSTGGGCAGNVPAPAPPKPVYKPAPPPPPRPVYRPVYTTPAPPPPPPPTTTPKPKTVKIVAQKFVCEGYPPNQHCELVNENDVPEEHHETIGVVFGNSG